MALIRSTICSAQASVRLRKIPWATAPWKDDPLVVHGDVDCANLFEGSSLDRYCRHEGGEADQGGVDQAYALHVMVHRPGRTVRGTPFPASGCDGVLVPVGWRISGEG